jgi:hypothetical protein
VQHLLSGKGNSHQNTLFLKTTFLRADGESIQPTHQMTGRDTGSSAGHIYYPAFSHNMRKGNTVDCVAGFKVMNRSVDMSARVGAHVEVADKVVPAIHLPEYRLFISGINEDIFREWSRDINNVH